MRRIRTFPECYGEREAQSRYSEKEEITKGFLLKTKHEMKHTHSVLVCYKTEDSNVVGFC